MAAGALLSAALAACSSGTPVPVAVPSPAPSGAAAFTCRSVMKALPDELGGLPARPTSPDSPYTAAYGAPAVLVRCGVPRPAALQPTSFLQGVDGVSWLEEPGNSAAANVWTAVDRPVRVALTVPQRYPAAADFLVDLSQILAKLPSRPVS